MKEFRVGDYIETKYNSYTFRGHITHVENRDNGKPRYFMTPDEGITLPHARFREHGDHICTISKMVLIKKEHFNEDLFTL